jgi:hypothetical protein
MIASRILKEQIETTWFPPMRLISPYCSAHVFEKILLIFDGDVAEWPRSSNLSPTRGFFKIIQQFPNFSSSVA